MNTTDAAVQELKPPDSVDGSQCVFDSITLTTCMFTIYYTYQKSVGSCGSTLICSPTHSSGKNAFPFFSIVIETGILI